MDYIRLISMYWIQIVYVNLTPWSSVYNSVWYTYGTLIGESITRDLNSAGANGVRCVVTPSNTYFVLFCDWEIGRKKSTTQQCTHTLRTHTYGALLKCNDLCPRAPSHNMDVGDHQIYKHICIFTFEASRKSTILFFPCYNFIPKKTLV